MANKTLNGECLCGEISWQMSGPFEFFGMCSAHAVAKLLGQHLQLTFLLNLSSLYGSRVKIIAMSTFCLNRTHLAMPIVKLVVQECQERLPVDWFLFPLGAQWSFQELSQPWFVLMIIRNGLLLLSQL